MSDGEEVKVLSSKEIKKIAKPKFAAEPEKYYPVTTMTKLGFSRYKCEKCGEYFWRHNESVKVCGDSTCVGKYEFIGRGTGIGRGPNGRKITYAEAWETFRKSLTTARIPATAIHRYPVVARWRTDVDYVAAGIYCFQPHCVTGELEPPANPLICPQFCLRFNDLDNIGLSGRHFSGFVMLGLQVFNTPEKYVFFKEECVEFNLRWLHEELGIPLDEITLVEDVWCGGGNIGPSVEYFIGGLEIGNMVFMQYKITDATTGEFEPLKVQVIDVGIGLERIPWLINGCATSYMTTYPRALDFVSERLGLPFTNPTWEKFGPYSCLLNMDEVDDIDAVWQRVATECGCADKEALLKEIAPARDMYIICDHTRSVLVAVEDGSLPSAVGGASNLRNVLRRVFMLLHKNGWWDKLGGMKGLLELFDVHRQELALLYGPAPEYKSFNEIIEVEYQRWLTTDEKVKATLNAFVKKRKGKPLTVNDWLEITRSFGISADSISATLNLPIPDKYFSLLAEMNEQKKRAPPQQLYDTTLLPATVETFYTEQLKFSFDAKIVAVMERVEAMNKKTGENSIVVLDSTCFYPNAGGQDNDLGTLRIDGEEYKMVYAEKVGKAILHTLDRPLPKAPESYVGMAVHGEVDRDRRIQLRNHHTATHIVYQSARRVLGPHVWQHGAKKTVEEAHLDITHFAALTEELEQQIEAEANRAVREGYAITKTWMPKELAEKTYGYKLYQGGVAAGKELRVVNIEGFDTEACCGTHCDNTSQVGMIRIIRTHRLSDGVVRLHFVAGERALQYTAEQSHILRKTCDIWGVQPPELFPTADRIFRDYKKYSALAKKQAVDITQLQVRSFIAEPQQQFLLVVSDEPDPTLYHTCFNPYAAGIKAQRKALVAVGKTFIYAVFGAADLIDIAAVEKLVEDSRSFESKTSKRKKEGADAAAAAAAAAEPAKTKWMPLRKATSIKVACKGKKPEQVTDIVQLSGSIGAQQPVVQFFQQHGFKEFQL